MTPEELLQKGIEIMAKKNHDYTTSGRYENFERAALVSSWFKNDMDKVFATLMTIKLARLASLLDRGKEPNNESITDSFTDLVNYGALWGAWRSSIELAGKEESSCSHFFTWNSDRGLYVCKSCFFSVDRSNIIIMDTFYGM